MLCDIAGGPFEIKIKFLLLLVVKSVFYEQYLEIDGKSINARETQKRQSRMDNPEKLATFGTPDTGRRQSQHQTQDEDIQNKHTTKKTKTTSNTDPPKIGGKHMCT